MALSALGGLVVVHTPDHTPGSICLDSPKRRIVFVGVVVLNNLSRLSRPLPTPGSVQAVYVASLWRLASLDFDACLFSHGPPVLEEGSRLVRDVAERAPSRYLLW
ncbi:MAG: hypothetical protein Q7O66_16140 [Dehalococcoidia bacterium]|nr:hypothetical protein [Dehalococcoidia bacterium]